MKAFSLLLLAVPALASPLVGLESPVDNFKRDNNATATHTIDISTSIYEKWDALFSAAASPPASATVETRTSSDIREDLNNGLCADVILIYARGTYSSGNIGTGIGVAFADALAAALPSVIVQGVEPYNNNIAGYLAGGDNTGADSMVALTEKAASQCPNAKIVWGGYSQGCQVTHKAGAHLPSAYYPRIAGIMLFGDPDNGQAFPGSLNNHVKTYCHSDDPICDGIPLPIAGHLTYADNAAEAAAVVATWV
ncbi:cutinase-domain-containing protein [Sphaerosporella brunnea]|uniref:Cutinase n=1 Tax=Sphaerosporella brunnea TaxID=1250544 RepID=A0A5J5EKL1_9PEZI|nr:cutinase-domain-containing protein [Sphaerosporella brunnea]